MDFSLENMNELQKNSVGDGKNMGKFLLILPCKQGSKSLLILFRTKDGLELEYIQKVDANSSVAPLLASKFQHENVPYKFQ